MNIKHGLARGRVLGLTAQLLAGVAVAAMLAAPVAPASAKGKASAGKIVWQASFESAAALAKKSGRPLFVQFVADWCLPCHAMDDLVFPTAQVVKASRPYIMVKVDGVKRPDLAKKYVSDATGRVRYPTSAFFSPGGKMVSRHIGIPLPKGRRYPTDALAFQASSFELAKMLNANRKLR